jgi:hypothetical protein
LTELTKMRLLMAPTADELAAVYQSWCAGLADLSDQQLSFGVAKARRFGGFLTLGVFREMCHVEPADFGLPDVKAAYLEAARSDGQRDNQHWSHPAVYVAGRECGWFELRNSTEREIYPRFQHCYEQICRRVMRGEQLDLPVRMALPTQASPQYLDPDENKRRCRALKEMLA